MTGAAVFDQFALVARNIDLPISRPEGNDREEIRC